MVDVLVIGGGNVAIDAVRTARLGREAGISNYRIFVDEPTGSLFAVLTLAEANRRDALPGEPVMQRRAVHNYAQADRGRLAHPGGCD